MKPDWLIVPALNTGTPERLIPALVRLDMTQAQKHPLRWHAEGVQIAAEVGYLDGATLRALLRQRLGRGCGIFEPSCGDGGAVVVTSRPGVHS